MAYYDLCVQLEHSEDLDKFVDIAGKLGWKGLGLVLPVKEMRKYRESVRNIKGLDIVLGAEVKIKRPEDLRKVVGKVRKQVELIVVYGGDLEVNRKAVETPEVDILVHPWGSTRMGLRTDPGVNHIMARLAAENNVSFGLDFRDFLYSYKKDKTRLLSFLIETAKLIKKYKSPFVITSGALSPWDLRAPSEFISFGKVLGFQVPAIKQAISDRIITENRKRLGSKWIMPGVEVE